MPRKHRLESPALRWAYERYVAGDTRMEREYEDDRLNVELAVMLYRLRTRAGLTQAQLADRIGTTASSISRLEGADYGRHSLSMLRRIARALGCRVEIRLVGDRKGPRSGHRRKRPAA